MYLGHAPDFTGSTDTQEREYVELGKFQGINRDGPPCPFLGSSLAIATFISVPSFYFTTVQEIHIFLET
jgi:hypothetical protein